MLNQPQSGNDMPRFAGLPTMMRLPAADQARGLTPPLSAFLWISAPPIAAAPAMARARSARSR